MNSNFRFRRFLHGVASSYVLLTLNILYVLGSVPLALHFLPRREFGLWALATQLTGYLQLIDLGMSGSVSRHLIDYKDNRGNGEYGSLIKTGALVLSVQGFFVLMGGAILVFFGSQFLHIDPDLERIFKIVMFVQCGIIAIDLPARLFGHVLVAHQRNDIFNYAQMGVLLVSFSVLWLGFTSGLGIYSFIWANAAGTVFIITSNIVACSTLGVLPSRGEWGRATWLKYRTLFGYGKDVFWIALGAQMINASQTIVVTRALGLNAAAVWSVCTRTYTLANQLVWRPFDSSASMLSEMVARGEKERLLHRFKGLVILTTSLAVGAAVMFTSCNQPFVTLWTHNKIGWGWENDILLSLWIIILALVHCHSGLPVLTKKIGFMRYIYFIEGTVFLVFGSYAARKFGFAGMLATSVICSLAFSFSYGLWRTLHEFNLSPKEILFRWLVPPARLFLMLTFFATIVGWLTRESSPHIKLLSYFALVAPVGALLLLRYGLDSELRQEAVRRAPAHFSRLLGKLLAV